MNVNRLVVLAIAIVIPVLVGVAGSVITSPAIPAWYGDLEKPSFSPPNWIFAPVWTSLYMLMGIASFLVWRDLNKSPAVRRALAIYGVQLLFNLLWSVFFFGLKNPGLAFIEIVVLFIAIAATMSSFWKISKPASMLLLPYLLWVTFAGILNFEIWQLNPT